MPPPPPTLLSLKQSFLTTQILHLSTPLSPSPSWTTANPSSPHPLPQKALTDALFKLNTRLSQHTKRVYPPQATRHVAEQIDSLFWNTLASPAEEEGIQRGVDLTEKDVIEQLPDRWEGAEGTEEGTRYEELVGRLRAVWAEREERRQRVERLRRMAGVLEVFEGDGVQENLVTRGGEVERELSRMRVLLARVGGRVAMLGEEKRGEEMEVDEEAKVGELVERF